MCNQNEISNMIGYHQPDLSTNMTVYASCLWLDSVIGRILCLTVKVFLSVTTDTFFLSICSSTWVKKSR